MLGNRISIWSKWYPEAEYDFLWKKVIKRLEILINSFIEIMQLILLLAYIYLFPDFKSGENLGYSTH